MGLCIGLKDKNNVYIGVNSHMFTNSKTAYNPNNFKVWNVLNTKNAIMACQGSIRDSNVIRIIPNLIDEYDAYKHRINYKYVLRNIAFRIKEELASEMFFEKKSGKFEDIESTYIFGYKNSLYEILGDLDVCEVDNYTCHGSGRSEAIGSLEATEGENPYVRIEKALRAASKSDNSIFFPFIILDTRSQKFKIIDK